MVYKPLYPTECMNGVDFVVRPLDMFISEVDRDKYPDISQKYRFELKKQNFKEELEEKRLKQCLGLFVYLKKILEKIIIELYNFKCKVEDGRKIKQIIQRMYKRIKYGWNRYIR